MEDINPNTVIASSYYAALGRVATAWSAFESELDDALAEFAGMRDPFIALCVTSQFGSTIPRIDAIRAIVELRNAPSDLTDELKAFAKSANNLRAERNDMIHGEWYFEPTRQQTVRRRIKARGLLKTPHDPITVEQILSLAEQISECRAEFIGIRTRMRHSLPPLPDAPSAPSSDLLEG